MDMYFDILRSRAAVSRLFDFDDYLCERGQLIIENKDYHLPA